MVLEQENRMKRVLGLFLALVMVFMICGNSVSVFASDFDKAVGVWKLVEMTGDDNLMSKEDVEAYEGLGIAMYLKLRDNGTAKFSLYGEDMEGTWSEYGIVLDYAWLTYIVDGDQLIVDNQDGGGMVFRRSSMEEIYEILGYREDVLDESVKYSEKEKTILDTKAASVVITGYKADMTGFTVKMRCENKSGNGIMIGMDKCVLNKYFVHPDWTVTLDPKERQETEMRVLPVEIEKTGITSVDEMILEMSVSNAVTEQVLQKGIMVTVYPTGKKADQVTTPQRVPVENEQAVIMDETCTCILQGTDLDDIRGYTVNCYLENKSDRALDFTWSNVTINGKPVNLLYEEAVLPGTIGYSDVIFQIDKLQDAGVNSGDISTIAGKVMVYDKSQGTPQLLQEKDFTYSVLPIQ